MWVPFREADSKEGQLVGGHDEQQWVIIAGGIENIRHEYARWYVPIKIKYYVQKLYIKIL